MRFRRRFHGGFRHRGNRPQYIWFASTARTLTAALTTAAPGPTSTTTADFSGSVVDAGLEQRLTLRSARFLVTFGTATVLDTDVYVRCGILKSFSGASGVPDPTMAAASDKEQDWIDLWDIPIPNGTSNEVYGIPTTERRIKVMRRFEELDTLIFVAKLIRGGGDALQAGQSLKVLVQSRILFNRTTR